MNKKELLFELAKRIVFEEGGDGNVVIVSSKYDVLAEDFLKYEKKLEKPRFISKIVNSDATTIAFFPEESSEECIVFSLDIGVRTIEMYDSVIFLRL